MASHAIWAALRAGYVSASLCIGPDMEPHAFAYLVDIIVIGERASQMQVPVMAKQHCLSKSIDQLAMKLAPHCVDL